MHVYVVVFGLAVTISYVAEQNWRAKHASNLPRALTFTAAVTGLLLAGVSALRWRVGTDYWTYEESFPLYAAEAEKGLNIVGEPGLRVIAWVSMKISGDPATMFAIAAFLTIGLTTWTLWKWSPAFSLSIALYIVTGAWYGSFNGVRQYMASAILFAGHRYIIERKPVKWLGVVFIAFLFHTSAVIGVAFYLLPTKRTTFSIQALLLGLGVGGMFAMDSILSFLESFTGDTNRWGGTYAEQAVNPIRIAFNLLPIALFWILKVKDKIRTENAWFYVNMLVVYAATYLASLTSALIARFAIYSLPFLAVALVYVTWVENPRERAFIRFGVICLYAVFMYMQISSTSNLHNFQWIFERP